MCAGVCMCECVGVLARVVRVCRRACACVHEAEGWGGTKLRAGVCAQRIRKRTRARACVLVYACVCVHT